MRRAATEIGEVPHTVQNLLTNVKNPKASTKGGQDLETGRSPAAIEGNVLLPDLNIKEGVTLAVFRGSGTRASRKGALALARDPSETDPGRDLIPELEINTVKAIKRVLKDHAPLVDLLLTKKVPILEFVIEYLLRGCYG